METTIHGREPAAPRSALSRYWRAHTLQIGIVGVALLIWVFFAVGAPETFFSYNIYRAFMSTTPFFAIVALPLTLVVITGEIDLSFPAIMSFGMLAFALVLSAGGGLWLALLACLAAGFLTGLLNGYLIIAFGVPSLVVTIGTQFFWRGVVQVATGGNGTSLLPARGTLLYELLVGRLFGQIPMQMVWTVVIALLTWLFLNRHRFGAHLYLIGDNVESARLMGVNVAQRKMLVFAWVGIAAAFAGLIASLEVTYYWPTLGEGYLLNTLSSVFLGGTSVFGGTGTVFGTFVASFIVGAINAGIVAVGLSGFWTQLIYGLIIVLSVILQTVIGRRFG
ncbi:MAG: sugar ABC transporter permease [Chloroflexi bacterium]|nr:MAG: sugar ABC transporter permease [Chloroflexota bacterium]